MLHHTHISSPIGWLKLTTSNRGVLGLQFIENSKPLPPSKQMQGDITAQKIAIQCKYELELYFNGQLQHFTIPTYSKGGIFYRRVWQYLSQIPYGYTTTYQAVAKQLGKSTGARAVGNACANNKIMIIVPCHRVVGSRQQLTGYLGGLGRKKWLLQHEQQYVFGKQGRLFN